MGCNKGVHNLLHMYFLILEALTSSLLCVQGLSRKSILDKVDLGLFQSSTKIEALMEVLVAMSDVGIQVSVLVRGM